MPVYDRHTIVVPVFDLPRNHLWIERSHHGLTLMLMTPDQTTSARPSLMDHNKESQKSDCFERFKPYCCHFHFMALFAISIYYETFHENSLTFHSPVYAKFSRFHSIQKIHWNFIVLALQEIHWNFIAKHFPSYIMYLWKVKFPQRLHSEACMRTTWITVWNFMNVSCNYHMYWSASDGRPRRHYATLPGSTEGYSERTQTRTFEHHANL